MQYFTDTDLGLDLGQVHLSVESAFADHGRGLVQMPPKVYITLPEGDFRTMPAYLPSLSIAGVKIVNVHPKNPHIGLPTVMALTIILDLATGQPLAIINATRLTDMRTGAAGAIAAKHLSPKKEIVLGVIGTGRQAEAQAAAISRELKIKEIRIWGRNPAHVRKFADRFMEYPCVAATIEKACDCDVLVTTTPPRPPSSGASGSRKVPISTRSERMLPARRNWTLPCCGVRRSLWTILPRQSIPVRLMYRSAWGCTVQTRLPARSGRS